MAVNTPVAFGAWKGRKPFRDTDETVEDAEQAPTVALAITDLLSLILLVVGFMCGAVGLAALLGWPGILIAVFVTFVPVALMMGVGDG